MNPIVIIGSGLAGYNVARELRKLDKQAPLTIIAADSAHFYSKPMLSSALASKKAPEAIPMNTAEQMAQQLGVTVRPRTSITAIDAPKHSVRVETTRKFPIRNSCWRLGQTSSGYRSAAAPPTA